MRAALSQACRCLLLPPPSSPSPSASTTSTGCPRPARPGARRSPPRRWPRPTCRRRGSTAPASNGVVPPPCLAVLEEGRDGAALPGPHRARARTSWAPPSSRRTARTCSPRSTSNRSPSGRSRRRCRCRSILGRVTAHEIGHLLLGANSHTAARPDAGERGTCDGRSRPSGSSPATDAAKIRQPAAGRAGMASSLRLTSEGVEQELERAVRLGAERDLRAAQHQPAACRPAPRRSRPRRRDSAGPRPSRCAAAPASRTRRSASRPVTRRPGRAGTPGCCRSRRRPAPACPRRAAASVDAHPQHRARDVVLLPLAAADRRPPSASTSALVIGSRRCAASAVDGRSRRSCRRPRGTPSAPAPCCSAVTRPICDRYGSGTVAGSSALPGGAAARLRDQVVGEDQDVVAARSARRRRASAGRRPRTGTRTARAASGSSRTGIEPPYSSPGRCAPAHRHALAGRLRRRPASRSRRAPRRRAPAPAARVGALDEPACRRPPACCG